MLSAFGPLLAGPAAAQDASFGCKVLLCSAATSPGWPSVPYCVPVMQTLFRILAKGGSWPSCPEARTGGLGYEAYQTCPAGQTPVQPSDDAAATPTEASNGNLCADLSKPQQDCSTDAGCRTRYPTTPRAIRSEPHFVEITTANGVQRFYFSLQGY
ncbi:MULTISPECIES: hypothetical protein [unclassified Bosea (in: a-proteobacteria)]|uniref:hypothetical protein n=1 Tax=unclassified Bosea (in: a-proteobacteria) TaxID=2653178 RepID=UPI001F460368|nr:MULTISPECIES: hypothetical protein [unclassified Bosea (in: a-proteobacteria)]